MRVRYSRRFVIINIKVDVNVRFCYVLCGGVICGVIQVTF